MFRNAFLRTARSATSRSVLRSTSIARPDVASRFVPVVFHPARCYSAAAGLSKPEVEGRIVDLLKNFDKVRSLLLGP